MTTLPQREGSTAEIDEVDVGEGLAEEVGAEALELFDGVGSEAVEGGRGVDLRLRGKDERGGRGGNAEGRGGEWWGGSGGRDGGGHWRRGRVSGYGET